MTSIELCRNRPLGAVNSDLPNRMDCRYGAREGPAESAGPMQGAHTDVEEKLPVNTTSRERLPPNQGSTSDVPGSALLAWRLLSVRVSKSLNFKESHNAPSNI